MPSEDEITKAVNLAGDSADPWQQWDAAKALAQLGIGGDMPKLELVELVPAIAAFIKKGMKAQQAVDAVLAEYNEKQKS